MTLRLADQGYFKGVLVNSCKSGSRTNRNKDKTIYQNKHIFPSFKID